MSLINLFTFLAGLGLFLYGMDLLERVLKKLSGRPFKLFLRKYSQNIYKAIAGGTIVTGLLQSSSVTSLLVLGFVESGIITFRNALGIILGSNLGTTLDSWVVATVGFKLNLENYSLPAIAITSIGMFFLHRKKNLYNLLRVFFSIGLLFLGIGYMKSGAGDLVNDFNLASYTNYGSFVFVIIGFVITTLIQSSSATIAITLTALYSEALTFPSATAIVIGSELGTTIKIVLAGMKGSADKKRTAWGNFTFNLVASTVSYSILPWLIIFIQNVVNIKDPLIGLVFFQTSINILTILIFLPFINIFAEWLEKRFKNSRVSETKYIKKNTPIVPEIAVEDLYNEVEYLLQRTTLFQKQVLHTDIRERGGILQSLRSLTKESGIEDHLYRSLKQTEGDILDFFSHLQADDLDQKQYKQVNQYISAARHSIHAAKSLRDINHDLQNFESSVNDLVNKQYYALQENWIQFDNTFQNLLKGNDQELLFENLTLAMKEAFKDQQVHNSEVVEGLHKRQLNEIETSTLMNVEREVLSAKKSLLRALAHLKLDSPQADEFEFLPEH